MISKKLRKKKEGRKKEKKKERKKESFCRVLWVRIQPTSSCIFMKLMSE